MAHSDVMDYIQISTLGNATDFGDLTVARGGGNSCADYTRACFLGTGETIDYITISTLGNATDFGDLSETPTALYGTCSSTTRGFRMGGEV